MAEIGSIGLDVGIYGLRAARETILDLAKYAEATGFESIWLPITWPFRCHSNPNTPTASKGISPPASPIR